MWHLTPWPDFEGRCGEVRTSPEIVLHLPWEFLHLNSHLKSHAPSLGKVSVIDQSEHFTFWLLRGYYIYTLRKKVFSVKLKQL